MSTETQRICPHCQQPLPANAPEGLCPQCLLRAAAAPPSEPQPVTTSGGDIPDIGDPVAVGKCLPQFEILSLLGRGGMGVVYKARQLNLDRIVALKILPPVDSQSADFVERFRREARSLAKLSHPNIVAVHDFGESGGLYYFAMEFVDGANLREMIRTGKMRPEEALAVVPKICDALQFAHEEGVVHRDVKPENILIDKRGRVKIADFGLAKLLRRELTDHTLTMSGMTLGTPRYMAPEQLDKPETVDHRADIYSLGVVFYEMLTGEVPMGRFAPPSEKVRIDVRLDEIVLHALERDADRRYQHVSQVRDDVERVTSKPRVVTVPKSVSAPPAARIGHAKGQIFKIQVMPRNAKDWLLGLAIVPLILGVFGFLPGWLAHVLTLSLGMKADVAFGLSVMSGIVVLFGIAALLGTGSVESVRVSHDGLTIHRYIGPSKFLPWSIVRGIEPMLPGEVFREVWMWPGFPPRGSIVCMSADGFHRINCEGDCWYFNPRNARKFFDAIERYQRPENTKETEGESSPGSDREDVQHTVGSPAIALIFAAVLNVAFAIMIAVISSQHNRLFARSSSPLGGTEALWSAVLFVAGILMFEGARRILRLTSYPCALASAIVACIPFGVLYGLKGSPVLSYISPLIGMGTLVTLLNPRVREAFDTPANDTKRDVKNNEPRLSRLALWGAILVPLFLIAAVAYIVFIGSYDHPSHTGWAADVTKQRPVWFIITAVIVIVVGIGTPLATTILGTVAVAKIKRSGGKLYGLRLAAADALCFPLLLLAGLVTLATTMLWSAAGIDKPNTAHAPVPEIVVALVVCLFVGRTVWRKINGSCKARDAKPVLDREAWWFGRSRGVQKLMSIVLGAILVLSLLGFFSFRMQATTTADHSGVVRSLYDFTIGLGDPWMFLLHHKTGTRGGFESGMNFIAGSALFGYAAWFAGIAFTRLTREQKRRGALADASTDTPQRKFFRSAVASAVLFIAGVAGVIVHEMRNDENGGLLADAVHEVHPDFTRPGVTSLALKKAIADELKLTPEQLEKVNQSLNRHYLEFLELENQHSEYRSEHGHLVKVIKPFPDRSFALAQRLAAELLGIAGRPIIDQPERNAVWKLRLFRHAGEFNVRAELWEKDGKYHREETWERDGKKITGGKSGETLTDMNLAFEHYIVDWQLEKDIVHEPRPDDAGNSYTMGFDVLQSGIHRIRAGELARMLAVKDPDAVVRSGDPHAALVAQTNTTLGRSCAETDLKRHGIPFVKDASPELLVTKLEELLGETKLR